MICSWLHIVLFGLQRLGFSLVSHASCYKSRSANMMKGDHNKRLATKVMLYFPIIPCLKHSFTSAKTTNWWGGMLKIDLMMESLNDGKLRHLIDGTQWRAINHKYRQSFSNEIRNIRFGLSMDGMNPFNMVSNNHSTWPMSLCIYNLLPWLCMKRTYLLMLILIQGPKQPAMTSTPS